MAVRRRCKPAAVIEVAFAWTAVVVGPGVVLVQRYDGQEQQPRVHVCSDES